MPSPVQPHSKVIFRDPAAGAALPAMARAYIVTDSTDRVFSADAPETAAFVNDGSGTYVLTDGPIAPGADRLLSVFVGDTVYVY
jgi:hypothetical protein